MRPTSQAAAVGGDSQARGWESVAVQDELFLLSEHANAHMHVAATLVLNGAHPVQRGTSVDIRAIRRHLDVRLDTFPRYRQRLEYTPLWKRPVWVDDARFDIRNHVRHLALPRPGTEAQLKALSEELLSRPLERRRPLWEVYVVEGVRGGRFAIIAKVHHCMVDGVGGMQLLAALFDAMPGELASSASTWRSAAAPTVMKLLTYELARPVARTLRALGALGEAGGRWAPAETARWIYGQATALTEVLQAGLQKVPASPLNQPIGPDRRIEWLTLDLDAVKAVKQRLGGTVNDVVLTTVAGGLRRFLKAHRGVRRPSDLRSMVPVDRRANGDGSGCGNHIGGLLVSLPVSIENSRDRHQAVRVRMADAKASQQATGSEVLTASAASLLNVGVWLAEQLQPFNLIVTNVPGPPVPFYLGSAALDAIYPQVPLFANQGLGIALFSYAGKLCWGFNADGALLPDVAAFAQAIAAAFADLCNAAGVHTSATRSAVSAVADRPVRSARSPSRINGGARKGAVAKRGFVDGHMAEEQPRASA